MTTESEKPVSIQPDDQYTSLDTEQFSALVVRCQQQSPATSNRDGDKQGESTRRFDYTARDDAVFEKLMGIDCGPQHSPGNETKSIRHYAKAKNGGEYTSTDQENFTALMSFSENDMGNCGLENTSLVSSRQFSYTDQDRQNFERLNPLKEKEDVNEQSPANKEAEYLFETTDRDVGVIKIIEYDKPMAERLNKEDRPNENVKIRFFD